MTRTSPARRAALIAMLAMAGGLVALTPGLAQAAPGEIVATGWWTRLPTATAPEGGVNVGSAPDGPNSIAALRIDLGSGLADLTITAVEAASAPAGARVRMCNAADDWTPASGGPLPDAPELDCSTAVELVRADDGTWSGDASALVTGRSGNTTIALVAEGVQGSAALGAAPSEVQYERPTAAGTPVARPTTPTTATRTPSSTPSATASAPPAFSSGPLPAAPRLPVAAPVNPLPAPDAAAAESTTTTTTATQTPVVEERALPSVTSAGVSSGGGRPLQEALFLALLALLVGATVGGISKLAEARSATSG